MILKEYQIPYFERIRFSFLSLLRDRLRFLSLLRDGLCLRSFDLWKTSNLSALMKWH